MAAIELSILKGVAVTKTALAGALKVAIASVPMGLPLVIAGGVGSLLFFDRADDRTDRIRKHSKRPSAITAKQAVPQGRRI